MTMASTCILVISFLTIVRGIVQPPFVMFFPLLYGIGRKKQSFDLADKKRADAEASALAAFVYALMMAFITARRAARISSASARVGAQME